MSGHGRKKKRGADHNDHPDERWLVTYADLMTLLVALLTLLSVGFYVAAWVRHMNAPDSGA